MTEEENSAIERLWWSITDVKFCCLYSQEECDEDKRIVLKLIQKQQAELEKKDKIISKMSGYIELEELGIKCSVMCIHENCKEECIIEYFKSK